MDKNTTLINNALKAPVSHRKIIEGLVCTSCRSRLDGLFTALQDDNAAAPVLTKPMTRLEVAYILGRKGIKSNAVKKLQDITTFQWTKGLNHDNG